MQQIKWKLLIVALLGVALAYAGRPAHFVNYHRYSWARTTQDGKYYTGMDLTWYGWTKGIDYDCVNPYLICTFQADPMKIHSDATGNWFYISDVPQAGIDNTGMFLPMDY
jgi:hypothetical protein